MNWNGYNKNWTYINATDITSVDDVIYSSSENSPIGEDARKVIDNSNLTKYLNLDGVNSNPVGFAITPIIGSTIINAISLETLSNLFSYLGIFRCFVMRLEFPHL